MFHKIPPTYLYTSLTQFVKKSKRFFKQYIKRQGFFTIPAFRTSSAHSPKAIYSGTPPKFARFELTHECDIVSYATAGLTNKVHGVQLNPSVGGSNSTLISTLQVPESAEYCLDVFAHSSPDATVKFTLTPQDGSATVELTSTDVGSGALSGSTLSFTHHKLTTCKLNANVKYDVYAFVQKGYLNVNSVFVVNPAHSILTTPMYAWQRTE